MSSSDTKLIPLNFNPGINRERTRYSTKGHWYDGNRVRFRDGQPENIRGWAKKLSTQFDGIARAVTSWASLSGSTYAAFGTDQLLYLFNGGALYDITPVYATIAGTPLTGHTFAVSSGSNRITVDTASLSPAFSGLSITQNTHVIVSTGTVSTIAGISLQQEFRTSVIISSGSPSNRYFRIISDTNANATTSVITTAASFTFLLQAGGQTQTEGLGYGTYLWNVSRTTLGVGTGYGTPAPVGSGFNVLPRNWTFTNWGEDLIATPRGGKIYTWVENNGKNTRAIFLNDVALTVAPNTPTQNTLVIGSPGTQRLLACGTMQLATSVFDPMLIRWCSDIDTGSYNQWIPAESNTAGDLRLGDGSEIRGAVLSRNQILVWTDNALHGVNDTGGSFVFTSQQIGTNCGLVGLHAAIEADGIAFWMSQKNFFMFDGTLRILDCTVKEYIFDNLDTSFYDKVYAGFNKEFTEVTWLYVNSGDTECNRYVSYNPVENWWSFGEAKWTSWEDKKLFDTILTTGNDSYFYDNEPDNVYTGDGSGITSFIESGEFDLDAGANANNMVFVDRVMPDVQLPLGGSINLTLDFKRYPLSSTSSTKGPFQIQSTTEKVSTRGRGRIASIKVERGSPTANTEWKLGKLHIDMMADGPR